MAAFGGVRDQVGALAGCSLPLTPRIQQLLVWLQCWKMAKNQLAIRKEIQNMSTTGVKQTISQASTHPIVSAYADTPTPELLFALEEHNFVVVVRKGDGHLAGLVSRIDVVEAYLNDPEWQDKPVSDIMTPRDRLIWLPNSVDLLEAIRTMVDSDIHQLVVCGPAEGGRHPIGVITLADAIKALRDEIET
jgi:CBS domain-containing protein